MSLFTAAMAGDSTAATCTLKSLSKDSQILGLHLGTWVQWMWVVPLVSTSQVAPRSARPLLDLIDFFGLYPWYHMGIIRLSLTSSISSWSLRRLYKAMEKYMPSKDFIREEQEMLPGGDIRIKGNAWLRKAWSKTKGNRVPREAEFRRLIGFLSTRHNLCPLAH